MKRQYKYFLIAMLSAVISCEMIDDSDPVNQDEAEKIEMTFEATIEKGIESKTILDGSVGDDLRKVLWKQGDCIGIIGTGMATNSVEKFLLTETETTESGTFAGSIPFNSRYSAFYPYEMIISYYYHSAEEDGFYFELPKTQKYVSGSFDPLAAPMVASNEYGEELQFQNLCGLLALQLTGTDEIESIIFTAFDSNGKPVPLCGRYFSYRNDSGELALGIVTGELLEYSVTLECDEPVMLNPTTPTPFYFVLPPATYESFILMISTTDGKVMIKQGTKPLTIKRSDAAYARDFAYVENESVNLSSSETSNCYVVSAPGAYKFKGDIIGNGSAGIITDAGFHTSTLEISPASAELLWEDRASIVHNVSLKNDEISFVCSGVKGNALIAAKDADGNILWSWHIWVTDQPEDQLYINSKGNFTLLDRHTGAIHNAADDWESSVGLLYQWGRKDPFAFAHTIYNTTDEISTKVPLFTTSDSQAYLSDAVANPTVFSGCGYRGWSKEDNQQMWSTSKKTIYDPCPVGYRVPPVEVWDGFLLDGNTDQYGITEKYNVSGGWDKGWNFIYDGTNSTYYPAGPNINNDGNYNAYESTYGNIWSAEYYEERYSRRMYFYYYNDSSSSIQLSGVEGTTYAYFVRCMKDE